MLYFEIANSLASALVSIAGGKLLIGNRDDKEIPKDTVSQEADMKMMQVQARVAQEIAIAKRIETADEVEIEEFYEGTGEGSAGAQLKDGSISLGISGYGNKVTRRIYRFKGYNPIKEEVYKQDFTQVT